MGGVTGNLTNAQPAIDFNGQQAMFRSPQQAAMAGSQALPSADAQLGPDVLNPSAQSAAPLPSQIQQAKPSFLDAARTGPGGTANALSPQLSTKGKILTTLLSAAAGGLSAAGQKTVGGGFQQGMQLPWEMAGNRLGTQKAELENQVTAANLPFLRAQNFAKLGATQAETAKNQAETAAIPTKNALAQAQTEAAYYKTDPNVGVIDVRTGKPVTGGGLAPLTADEAQVLGKQPGDQVPLKLKNTANEIVNRGQTTINTEQGVFNYNRQTGTKTKLGDNPRNMFAPTNRIIEVADPDSPGQTKFVTAGDAVNSGMAGTKSASFQVPKKVLEWATTGKGGDEANAFNTALQHADLLEQAMTALNNGDVRTLNGLKNKFKTEFGSADMTNFQTIANAYGREITKMLSGGHMTDSEIASAGGTLPANASPEQILGAVQAYRSLAGSKMNVLYERVQKGMQGKPNFPAGTGQQGSTPPAGASHAVVVGGKVVGYTSDGKTMTPVQ